MGCLMSVGQRVQTAAGSSEEFRKRHSDTTKISLNRSRHQNESTFGINSSRDINDFYEIDTGTILGTGVSGTVRTCTHRATNVQFALKRLCKLELQPVKLVQLRAEIAIMTGLDHPNILRLLDYFETDSEIYLILELCKGGELLERLHGQPDHCYGEMIACKLVFTMLSAVRYCHAHNIVHRDLKLENFLFESESDDSPLKLIGECKQLFKPSF